MDRQKRLTQWVNEKPSSKEQKSLPANPPLPPPLSKGGIPSGHALFPPLRRKGETGNASNLRFVVPAKAGTQLCTRQADGREKKESNLVLSFCFKDKSPLPPFFKGGKRSVPQACPPPLKKGG